MQEKRIRKSNRKAKIMLMALAASAWLSATPISYAASAQSADKIITEAASAQAPIKKMPDIKQEKTKKSTKPASSVASKGKEKNEKPRKKSDREELAKLREKLLTMSDTQADILQFLDRMSERLDAIDRLHDRYRSYATSSVSATGYTQDAIDARGSSTVTFAYAPNQLYKIYCRRG